MVPVYSRVSEDPFLLVSVTAANRQATAFTWSSVDHVTAIWWLIDFLSQALPLRSRFLLIFSSQALYRRLCSARLYWHRNGHNDHRWFLLRQYRHFTLANITTCRVFLFLRTRVAKPRGNKRKSHSKDFHDYIRDEIPCKRYQPTKPNFSVTE
jgi:hypothetical protein